MIEEFDPNLVFVNLGDVDRMGHADLTGPVDAQGRCARRRSPTPTPRSPGSSTC